MHVSAESWVGSRSWQGEDRDKSLIYWVHFLVSQAVSNTPPPLHPPIHLTVQGQRGRNKRYGVRETGKNEVNRDRERERDKLRHVGYKEEDRAILVKECISTGSHDITGLY